MQEGRFRVRATEVSSGTSFYVSPSLPGRFQLENALCALAAARCLREQGFRISKEAIERGIAGTVWPGRLEKLQSSPDVYLDGAHNPGAARELTLFLEQNFARRKIWLLYGALRDKAAAEVIITEPRTSRAISASRLAEITAHHASDFTVVPAAEQALDLALSEAAPDNVIFITGSLYLVGQLRQYWKQRAQVATR